MHRYSSGLATNKVPFKKHKIELELGNRLEFFDAAELGIVGLERSIRVLVNLKMPV